MSDTTGGPATQAVTDPQPQAGTSPSSEREGAQAASDAGAAAAGGTEDLATAIRERDDARREAARHRAELRRLKDADLSETERLGRELAELRAERDELVRSERERALRYASLEAATRLGFRDPELAVRLLDRDAVETRDDGTPRNVERLLADVLERAPYLGRAGTGGDFGGGPRGQAPAGSDMNSLIRRAAGRT